tara:strand:+ start:575 stop:1105 length:531 start_codon:yes stop_codon:yes gene_type:complete
MSYITDTSKITTVIRDVLIIICLLLFLTSCERESYKVRNYTYPGCLQNPTGIPQLGSGIHVYPGESDQDLINRIREFEYDGKDFSDTIQFPYIFLSTDYWVSESQVGPGSSPSDDVLNPDPRYMLFPHSINSISDEWGWEYYEEYKELGEQEFCNKYLNGERTLGMKLSHVEGYKP